MQKKTVYDVDYFINKFEKIPEDNWIAGAFRRLLSDGSYGHCAAGHCGVISECYLDTDENHAEGKVLYKMFVESLDVLVPHINDGKDKRYQQPTPKQRILAAIYDIKKMQNQGEGDERSVVRDDQAESPTLTPRKNITTELSSFKPVEERLDENLIKEKA